MLFSGQLQCVLGIFSHTAAALQFGQNVFSPAFIYFLKHRIAAIFPPNVRCQFRKSTRTDE